MAGIIYEFIEELKNEIKLYEKLFELADEKKTHIIKGDVSKINETTGKEESVVMVLKGLERQRKQFLLDIASILGLNKDTITITQIVESMKNQPDEAEELNKTKDALLKALERLRIMNSENLLLINQSLEYAEFSINVLQSSMDGPAITTNYGKDGDSPKKSFFDTKQ